VSLASSWLLEPVAQLALRTPKIAKDERLTRARELMRSTGLRVLPVVDSNKSDKLVGVLYRIDVLRVTSSRSDATVSSLASEPPVVLRETDDVASSLKKMLQVGEWYAPIVDGSGKLLGVFGLESAISLALERDPGSLESAVSEHYKADVAFVTPDDDVSKAWQLMLQGKYSGLPVVKRGCMELVGVVTEYDLLKRGYARLELESESPPRRVRVREVMTTPAVSVKPHSQLVEAAEAIVKRNIGRVFVTDEGGKLLGLVDREVVVKAALKRRGALA